jgi:endoglycosylceramidase
VADKNNLQPAYDVLTNAIRAVDEATLVFFAAITWDDPIPAGFTAAPGGDSQAPSSVFAYHYYSPPQFNDEIYFHTRINDARRLGVGAMLTEFERPRNDDDMVTDPYFATVAAADEHLQSWAMWELKTFCKETNQSLSSDSQNAAFGSCKTGYGEEDYLWDSEGVLNRNTSLKLARTYAQAVAGNTTRMHFDVSSAKFVLEFALDTTISVPTVVFAHQPLQYPTGFDVQTLPPNLVRWNAHSTKPNSLEFWPLRRDNEEDFGKSVTVIISRKDE